MPLLDLPDQLTHRAYIHAVASALAAAGVPVTAVFFPHEEYADLFLLRRAVLDLDMRATWPVYGDQEVSLLWSDETGWSVGWGPAGDMCGASFTVCRSLLAEPADVVAAARAALTAPPTEDVPCPFRSCMEHDEELEAVLDTYTLQEMNDRKEPAMDGQDTSTQPQHGGTPHGPGEDGPVSHTHTALDVPPDCVTLCVDNGTRWWHAPMDAIAWKVAPEDVRETWRGLARRPSGDATLPVTVVTREDVGPFPGE